MTQELAPKAYMSLTHYSLDTFVAQEMSKLTDCAPESLVAEFPSHIHWLNQFILRRIFHDHVREEYSALALFLIRRTEAALEEWELACAAAQDAKVPYGYFKTLRHLESCIANLWQGLALSHRSINFKLFEKGDGSVYERLNWLYNVGRHFDPQDLQSGDLHRLWISNDGLNTREHVVTFVELRDEIKALAEIVEMITGHSPIPS